MLPVRSSSFRQTLNTLYNALRSRTAAEKALKKTVPSLTHVNLNHDPFAEDFFKSSFHTLKNDLGFNLNALPKFSILPARVKNFACNFPNGALQLLFPKQLKATVNALQKWVPLKKVVDAQPHSIILHELGHLLHIKKLYDKQLIPTMMKSFDYCVTKTTDLIEKLGQHTVNELWQKASSVISTSAGTFRPKPNTPGKHSWDLREFVAEFFQKYGNLKTDTHRQRFVQQHPELYKLYVACEGPSLEKWFGTGLAKATTP